MTAAAPGLDRDAPLPLYFQLRQALLGEIREGGLKAGDRLPTEAVIADRYGVSRATIRHALAQLALEGVIRRVQGLGTFVAAPKIRHLPLLTSFSELVTAQGFAPSHRVLSSEVADAPDEVAAALDVPGGAPCRHLRRLLLADDRVVGLADTWLPQDLIGEHGELLDAGRLGRGSLYELLQSAPVGLRLDHAVETISPGVAAAGDAQLLGCTPGSPILVIRRLTYLPAGRPVEWTRLLFVGERYEYRVDLHRPSPPAEPERTVGGGV